MKLIDGFVLVVLQAITGAEQRLAKQVGECDLKMYFTEALTKSDVKKSGLSPDGVMQMCVPSSVECLPWPPLCC